MDCIMLALFYKFGAGVKIEKRNIKERIDAYFESDSEMNGENFLVHLRALEWNSQAFYLYPSPLKKGNTHEL